jgi:ubiquinone/menaquinone biosynthesis C-methylase UbiE
MSTAERFDVTAEMAEAYEERFVPALFAHWVEPLLDAADVQLGQRVLDVGCGTGVVARHAAERVGPAGGVVGLDRSAAMLEVAARVRPDLEWREGDVANLPFPEADFDVVTCQAMLMFVPDVDGALRAMARVVRPGGAVAIQVFALLADQPAYGPWVEMVARHAGPDAVQLLGTYWAHGDQDRMRARCESAGLNVSAVVDLVRPASFPSVEAMVRTEVNATPLAERLTEAEQKAIVTESRQVLEPWLSPDGEGLKIPIAGYVLVAERPA